MEDIHAIMSAAHEKARHFSRSETQDEIAEFIADASLQECKLIIADLIDRVATLTGCAPELEDAACAINRAIIGELK